MVEVDLKDRVIGTWKVGSRLGGGGQGTVWNAKPTTTNRSPPRALKACFSENPTERARFEREIKLLRRCDGATNVLRIVDADTSWSEHVVGYASFAYYVSELCDGSLEDLHRKQKLQDAGTRLSWFAEACAAVRYLHEMDEPIVHRDIKPGNFLLAQEPRRLVLGDFGIARPLFTDETVTQVQEVVGTLHFRSPEVTLGQPPTVRSDVYSLGRLLEWLMTGDVSKNLTTLPIRGHRLSDAACNVLDEIVNRATRQSPAERYVGVAELVDALPDLEWSLKMPVRVSASTHPRATPSAPVQQHPLPELEISPAGFVTTGQRLDANWTIRNVSLDRCKVLQISYELLTDSSRGDTSLPAVIPLSQHLSRQGLPTTLMSGERSKHRLTVSMEELRRLSPVPTSTQGESFSYDWFNIRILVLAANPSGGESTFEALHPLGGSAISVPSSNGESAGPRARLVKHHLEMITPQCQAAKLLGGPTRKDSCRTITLSPHRDLGLELAEVAQFAASVGIWPRGDLQPFPPAHLAVVTSRRPLRRSTGIVWASEHGDATQTIGLDGSLAVQTRLQHDRKDPGHREQLQVGLYTTLESFCAATRYHRRLLRASSDYKEGLIAFRLELHGVTHGRLACDVPSELRDIGHDVPNWWNDSETSAEGLIQVAGNYRNDISDVELGKLLNQIAISIAAYFAVEDEVDKAAPGDPIVSGYVTLVRDTLT